MLFFSFRFFAVGGMTKILCLIHFMSDLARLRLDEWFIVLKLFHVFNSLAQSTSATKTSVLYLKRSFFEIRIEKKEHFNFALCQYLSFCKRVEVVRPIMDIILLF